ncbi:glycerophosphodiester phosphodiesterase [Streptomonospora litoralis]|uniref:Cytoplasmic glycerophosphodiester phosphodiesterase n=1 Tax=Streptomonospora litoralis TaxID=2498135 RepID=A0A4V0ZJZ2_9ACTN|nr:glycerophosphodiester phosphodiesterase [Streptomonospora litoralis]QBI55172.1 cytoplasmic glycerophosphodiester phosphodiesterase [Streptomonospora litoralis]
MTLAIALRGDTSRFRENTLPAIRSAIAAGADVLAVDLRTTADGHVVAVREDDADPAQSPRPRPRRAADRPELVETLSGLAALGSDVEQRIPTLMEVLAETAGGPAPCSLLCEVDDAQTALAAEAVIGEHGLGDRVCYTGSIDTLHALRSHRPALPIALRWDLPSLPAPEVWEALRPAVFSADHRILTRDSVLEIQRHGYRVAAWTVDDFTEMVRVAGMGVDAIVTADIGELVKLTRNGGQQAAESGAHEYPVTTPGEGIGSP